MQLFIKPCTSADLDELVRISRLTFSAAFAAKNNPEDFEHYLNSALTREKLLSELKNPDSQFYFVYLKGDLVGFFKFNEGEAQTDLQDPKALELERIYVLSEFQNKGIGRAMMAEVIKKARDSGKDYIWLGVWEKNTGAIAFYETLGFVTFGKHPFYIGNDKQTDWLLKLDLSS
jgi:ribosomal protein S18 acetylase RimI-like enzyme